MNCPECGKEMKELGDTGFVACIDCNAKFIDKKVKEYKLERHGLKEK